MKDYENLEENLKKFKPNVRPITIESYISYLQNLHMHLKGKRNFTNLKWLKNPREILEAISDKSYLSQRNILNAIIVALQSVETDENIIKEYVEVRNEFNEKYKTDRESGVVNEKQEKNMIKKEELNRVIDEYERYIKFFKCKNNKNLSKRDYLQLQLFVILKFHQTYALRNDLVTLKFRTKSGYMKSDRNYNTYLPNESQIILNEYKTSGKYGALTIDIDKKINSLLKCLIRQQQNAGIDNPDKYLLIKANGRPYSKVEFSNLLIRFFRERLNKSISSTILRKIYLEKYSDVKKEMAKDAEIMSHSQAVQSNVYIPK